MENGTKNKQHSRNMHNAHTQERNLVPDQNFHRTKISVTVQVHTRYPLFAHARTIPERFLLGTGRMPHPVGGAMGVTLCHCREKGIPRFDIISLNIHKTTSRWYCMAVVLRPRLLTFACLAWHPPNCSTALPKVFSSDLPVCQCIRTHMLV